MGRQLYEIGLLAMEDSLEGSRVEHYREVGYVLKASADQRASTVEYTREEFRNKIKDFLADFIVQEIELERLAEAKDMVKERQQMLADRAGMPIPTGFPTCLEQIMPEAPKEFMRDRPLVLVGERAHLDLLIDEVVRVCRTRPVSRTTPQLAILHCLDEARPTRVDKVRNQSYWQVGLAAWGGKADSPKKLGRALDKFAKVMIDETFDLVIFDDATQLLPKLASNAKLVATMLNLNKLVRKWAESWSCGLILAVPLEDRAQIDSEDWQRLAAFATVLQVHEEPSPKTGGHRLATRNLVLLDGIAEELLCPTSVPKSSS